MKPFFACPRSTNRATPLPYNRNSTFFNFTNISDKTKCNSFCVFIFIDEQFQVDKNDEAFRLLNPVLTKLDAEKTKDLEKRFSSLDNDAANNSDR